MERLVIVLLDDPEFLREEPGRPIALAETIANEVPIMKNKVKEKNANIFLLPFISRERAVHRNDTICRGHCHDLPSCHDRCPL
jgi:hypothetical protein